MSEEQFEREKLYLASMEMFKKMLERKLITKKQYQIIEEEMKKKYHPVFGTLFSV